MASPGGAEEPDRRADGTPEPGQRAGPVHELAPGPGARAWYAVASGLVKLWAGVCFRLSVEGRENLPTSGPYLLAPVHRSNIDFLMVSTVTRQRVRFLGKEELWKVAALGRLIGSLGAFQSTGTRWTERRCGAASRYWSTVSRSPYSPRELASRGRWLRISSRESPTWPLERGSRSSRLASPAQRRPCPRAPSSSARSRSIWYWGPRCGSRPPRRAVPGPTAYHVPSCASAPRSYGWSYRLCSTGPWNCPDTEPWPKGRPDFPVHGITSAR